MIITAGDHQSHCYGRHHLAKRDFIVGLGPIRLVLPVLEARACQPAAGRLKTDTGWKTGSRMKIPPYRQYCLLWNVPDVAF